MTGTNSEDESYKPARARPRRKWIRPKKYKIADEATLKSIINPPPKPKPEFIGADYIAGIKNESKYIFMCNEPNCSAKFTTALGLTLHGNKHLNKNIRCNFCNMLFKNKPEMDVHIDEFHVIDKPLQCKKCQKYSRDKMALWRHVRESHRDKKWPCPQCHFCFTRPENLKVHLLKQHPPKGQPGPSKIPCKTCGKEFAHNGALRFHVREKHRGKFETFRCVLCGTIYNDRTTYWNHMKRHINPTYFVCHICNVRFTSGHHMRRHKSSATHKKRAAKAQDSKKDIFPVPIITAVKTAKNPHLTKEELIELCKKTVVKINVHRIDQHIVRVVKVEKRPEMLQNIKEANTGIDSSSKAPPPLNNANMDEENDDTSQQFNLNCMYCDKAFPTLGAVKSHEFACFIKKRGKQISICKVCNKEFDKPFKLKIHSAKHTKERPFPCSYCTSFFKSRTIKYNHEKAIHFGIRQKYFKVKVHKCSYEGCLRQYSRADSLRQHVKSHHLGIRFTCRKCNREFRRMDYYHKHLRVDHAKCPTRLLCRPCNRTYKNRQNYLNHVRRERHRRKTREYQDKQNKIRNRSKQHQVSWIIDLF